MTKDVILTPEGLEKLQEELETLRTTRRREVAERIKEAREFGDIAENSEYDDAKNEQAMLESRIAQLQEKLRMATVIQAKDLSTDVVQVGSVGAKAAELFAGRAEVYLHDEGFSDWDLAAPLAVARHRGLWCVAPTGAEFTFNRVSLVQPGVVMATTAIADAVREAVGLD